jgi:hypothetical protein
MAGIKVPPLLSRRVDAVLWTRVNELDKAPFGVRHGPESYTDKRKGLMAECKNAVVSDNRWVGHLLALRCECGYESKKLVSGGVMRGVIELFVCGDCREVVSAQTWSVGYGSDNRTGEVEAICPHCGGRALLPWGDGDIPAGSCPSCARRVETDWVGIAD